MPGNHTNGIHDKTPLSNNDKSDDKPEDKNKLDLNEKSPEQESKLEVDKSDEEDYKPKTPSTAERRKMFENRSNSKENEPEDNFDVTDQSGNFERASVQRNSIAEKRKMYENRSQSVQETTNTVIEKPDGSPVLMRRKDSFKNRKNAEILKEDNNRKSVPMAKQQSLDPQAAKKADSVANIPKRTSTVFG